MFTLTSPAFHPLPPSFLNGMSLSVLHPPPYNGATRAPAEGFGRRAMREMMDPTEPDHVLMTAGPDGHTPLDKEKLNFVRMLLAIKMSKTDGVPGALPNSPSVYIGSVGAAYNLNNLKHLNITHVLNLCQPIQPKFPHDYTYLTVPCDDIPGFDIALKFIECADFIDSAVRASVCER